VHINNASVRIGADRQFGNSIFSIGADLILLYKSRLSYYYNEEYTIDSTGMNPPQYYSNYASFNDFTMYKVHYLGAGLQITGKMDVPINERFSLNLFAGPAASLNTSFKINNIVDPNDELEFLNDQPRISTLDFNLVAGIGLKFAVGK
jgi:hypothetical protein